MSIFKHKIKESNFPDEWMDNKPYIPVPKTNWIKEKLIDVSYGPSALQKVDIYYPNTNVHNLDAYPVLFNIHGGGFAHMDKADWHVYPGFYWLEKGYMLVSINYRLAPKAKFPNQTEDTLAAIRFVLDNAKKYKVDVNNIFIMGASAGGNLTLTSGLQLFNQQENSPYKIRALGALCPVTDISTIWFDSKIKEKKYSFLAKLLVKKTIKDYIGEFPTTNSLQPYDASYYIKDEIPAIYFQLGELDPIIKVDVVRQFVESVKNKGETVIDILPEGQHMGATKHFFLVESINGYLDFFEKKIIL